MSYSDRLVIDPRIHFGKPCVAGTRILVEHVLELIQEGIPFGEITEKLFFDPSSCPPHVSNCSFSISPGKSGDSKK